jgi:hypothetical protein
MYIFTHLLILLAKTTVPEPDKGTKSTIKNGVLVRGNDTRNRDPSRQYLFCLKRKH